MPSLSEVQAAQSLALTEAFKAQQNREAARVAALVALYYRQRVQVEDASSVDRWLSLVIPRIIAASDTGARTAAQYFAAMRRIEVPTATPFAPRASLGAVDDGVRKSLMAVGPGDYMNKARDIRSLEGTPLQEKALLAEAKQVTSVKLAQAVVRHAQTGGRQTVYDNAEADRTALGWIRVTRADPCFFCAMLASRGIHYRAFTEGAFDASDARFSGEGDAKVHDKCGCSLKAVYAEEDPVLERNQTFIDMWERWGAGGGDAVVRFRRAYNHFRTTGDYMSFDEANEGLRPA
jgi:hypothetical protein